MIFKVQSQTAFTSGNIAVLRIAGVNGTNGKPGSNTPGTSGVPIHIDEYSVFGGAFTFVRTIDLPAAPSNAPLSDASLDSVFMSSSNNEGFLTLSGDGKWLSFLGYDSVSATGTIYSTTNNPNLGRTVGLIKYDGTYNLHTKLSNFPVSGTAATPGNAITTNGTDLWATSGQGLLSGVLYSQTGATNAAASPSVVVSSTNISNRSLGIWGTDLYYVTASGKRIGMVSASGGIPTTNGNVMTDLTFAGSVLPASFSPSQMVLFDMDATVPGFDVMFVTNTVVSATNYGIYKYSKDASGTWNFNGGFDLGVTAGIYYGITGSASAGSVTLYASRGITSTASLATNQVVQIVDASGFNTTMNGTITATLSNSATLAGTLRGVALVPTVNGASATLTLPLTLQSFTGSLVNNNAQLSWSTTNEINVKEFIVERALNASDFSPIGKIDANNAITQNNYSYIDTFSANTKYYRLKVLDKEGRYEYSKIIVVTGKKSKLNNLSIFPNPVKNIVTITHAKAEKNAMIKVFSISGKLLFTNNVGIGSENTSLNVSNLTSGEYFVYYFNNGNTSSTKMIK